VISYDNLVAHQVFGLCGDFDGEPRNDLRILNGPITRKVNDFGKSHQVGECDEPEPPEEFVCPEKDTAF